MVAIALAAAVTQAMYESELRLKYNDTISQKYNMHIM